MCLQDARILQVLDVCGGLLVSPVYALAVQAVSLPVLLMFWCWC